MTADQRNGLKTTKEGRRLAVESWTKPLPNEDETFKATRQAIHKMLSMLCDDLDTLESKLSALEREREELSFAELRKANVERNGEWDSQGKLDVTFRGLEFAGEAGEVCNKLKKLERERRGLRGSRATKEELADELADSIITADLIGMMENVDFAEAVIRVFNRKSDELKLKRHLALASLTGKE